MSNLFQQGRGETDAGYFRIGNVVFNVPPSRISIQASTNKEERRPLRYRNPIFTKTGQAVLEVVASFVVMANDDYEPSDPAYWEEWEKLRTLLVMQQVAPFVEIESPHLRQIIGRDHPDVYLPSSASLTFGLHQIYVRTHAEIVDALDVDIRLILFNASPYTTDFAMVDDSSMLASRAFTTYLEERRADMPLFNRGMADLVMDSGGPESGGIKFVWRHYVAIDLGLVDTDYSTNAARLGELFPIHEGPPAKIPSSVTSEQTATAASPVPAPSAADLSRLSTPVADMISRLRGTTVSRSSPADGEALFNALVAGEHPGQSPQEAIKDVYLGRPAVVNGRLVDSHPAGLMQWQPAAIASTISYLASHGNPAYLNMARANGFMASGDRSFSRPENAQIFLTGFYRNIDSSGNVSKSRDYDTSRNWQGLSYPQQRELGLAWVQMNFAGRDATSAYTVLYHHRGQAPGVSDVYSEALAANNQADVIAWWRRAYKSLYGSSVQLVPAAPRSAPALPVANPQPPSPAPNFTPPILPASQQRIDQKLSAFKTAAADRGWTYDHDNGRIAFFFYVEEIDAEPGFDEINGTAAPNQIVVTFTNNFARIPLAAYVFPTLQHLGGAATQVGISLLSVSPDHAESEEPVHAVPVQLTRMMSQLESQFLAMRPHWRRADAVFDMQRLEVRNIVLNALGIDNLLLGDITTSTVDESPDTLQVTIGGSMYSPDREVTDPYLVIPPSSVLNGILHHLLFDMDLSNVFQQQQKTSAYPILYKLNQQIQKGLAGFDEDPAGILAYLNDDKDTYPQIPMPADAAIVPADAAYLRGLLSGPVNPSLFPLSAGLLARLILPIESSNWDNSAARIKTQIVAHTNLSYTDYYAITRFSQSGPRLQAIRSNYDAVLDRLYPPNSAARKDHPLFQLWSFKIGKDIDSPLNTGLDRELVALSRDHTPMPGGRTFADMFKTSIDDNQNHRLGQLSNHTAYLDMLIRDPNKNPFDYFLDHREEQLAELRGQAGRIVSSSLDNADKLLTVLRSNKPGDVGSINSMIDSKQIDTQGTSIAPKDRAGVALDIVNNTTLNWHSMRNAFPTFKLFLIEEDNLVPFYQYDNFYSHSAVLDIQVIRYRLKPDLAIVTISDTGHQLQHKVLDNSILGKYERGLSFEFRVPVSGAGPIVGPAGGAILAEENSADRVLQARETSFDGRAGNTPYYVPPKFFALQTGTKIQIRFGFDNNPDNLVPVFQGIVTELDRGDTITIQAQGFSIELDTPAPDALPSDGYQLNWWNNALEYEQVVKEALTPGSSTGVSKIATQFPNLFSRGAAFGGQALFSDNVPWIGQPSGDGNSVILYMLQTAAAKHFGHWRINAVPDVYAKGFSWVSALGRSVSDKLAIYDRTGENLRQFHMMAGWREFPSWWGGVGRTYYLQKSDQISPWQVILDNARRYPELSLLVKPYGYPNAVEATLVFGDPEDVYITRGPDFGRDSIPSGSSPLVTPDLQRTFAAWWSAAGRAAFTAFQQRVSAAIFDPAGDLNDLALSQLGQSASDAKGTLLALIDTRSDLGNFLRVTGAYHDIFTASPNLGFFQGTLQRINNLSVGWATTVKILSEDLRLNVADPWQFYLQSKQELSQSPNTRGSGRFRPIRRYHVIDHDSIINNGIKVNENIYNAVKLDGYVMKASASIPSHHTRVLDIQGMILYPDKNARLSNDRKAYTEWFLREELSQMYTGELVITGTPEIDPGDVILLNDLSLNMTGAFEVDSIVHSFSQDTGMISIIKPRAWVLVNSLCRLSLTEAVQRSALQIKQNHSGLLESHPALDYVVTGNPTSFAQTFQKLAPLSNDYLVASTLLIARAYSFIGQAILCGLEKDNNPMVMVPLTINGYPYVGGIEGYRASDMVMLIGDNITEFWATEGAPSLLGFKQLVGAVEGAFKS